MAEQQLNRAKVLRSPVNQRSLCATRGVRTVRRIVESYGSDPPVDHSSKLSRRDMWRGTQPAWKQIVDGPQSPCPDPGFNALTSLLSDLELNRSLRLLLHDHCPRSDMATLADVFHEQPSQVTHPEFAINCEVEHRQLSDVRRHLQPSANRPDFRELQWWLLSSEPAFIPRHAGPGGSLCVSMTFSFHLEGDSVCRAAIWSLTGPGTAAQTAGGSMADDRVEQAPVAVAQGQAP
jgi:hypothetical protein